MKFTAVLLASLALNALLLGALYRRSRPTAVVPPKTAATETTPPTARAASALDRAAVQFRDWQQLPAADLLAAIGKSDLPPRERFLLARVMLQEYESRRLQALMPSAETALPFWKPDTDTRFPEAWARVQAEMGGVWREFQRASFPHDPQSIAHARRQYGDLPLEKLNALHAASIDRLVRRNEILATAQDRPGGSATPAELAEVAAVDRAAEVRVRALLTPEEFAVHDLRGGTRANSLRQMLQPFQPTEQEFIAINAAYAEFDDILAPNSTAPEEAKKEARSAVDEKVKALLGEDRFADYTVAGQRENDVLNRLLARLDLPLRTASTVNAVHDAATRQAAGIRRNTSLTEAQRAAALSELAADAEQQLTATLGQAGFEAYEDLKGTWIRALRK